MDSTSTAGDFSPGELPRRSSAASLKAAEPQVQAEEVLSQPVQDGADGEESKTGVLAKQDLALDSPEATTAGAQADNEEDTHLITVKPSHYESSIDDSELEDLLLEKTTSTRHSALLEKCKKSGPRHARVSSTYTKGLEARVGTLENELLKLQYEVGSKERPDEVERQVLRDASNICR